MNSKEKTELRRLLTKAINEDCLMLFVYDTGACYDPESNSLTVTMNGPAIQISVQPTETEEQCRLTELEIKVDMILDKLKG